jgi:hypothetical protein
MMSRRLGAPAVGFVPAPRRERGTCRREPDFLVEFTMLDDRQYRTDNPCGDGESLRCEEAVSGRYTMLGREQERWLSAS